MGAVTKRSGSEFEFSKDPLPFASWLGLCSENISKLEVLYTNSRRVRSRVATALRMGAHSLHHAKRLPGQVLSTNNAQTRKI
jgi:hypothetical protein